MVGERKLRRKVGVVMEKRQGSKIDHFDQDIYTKTLSSDNDEFGLSGRHMDGDVGGYFNPTLRNDERVLRLGKLIWEIV